MSEQPARVMIGNADTLSWLSAQYNPETVTEQLEAVYKAIEVQGLSHEPLQYDHTRNLTLSFSLNFDGLTGRLVMFSDGPLQQVTSIEDGTPERARRFLHSLFYPRQGASNVAGGAPPKTLFVWPGLFSLLGRMTKLQINHKRFESSMKSSWFTAELGFTEARVNRLTSEDVLAFGTQR